MNILALECSSAHASLCLTGSAAFAAEWDADRNHDAYLFPALEAALRLATPELVLVGSGPGSYGGVRVALAAAAGISLARCARVVALCSWESLSEGHATILSDAKRGGWALRTPAGEISVVDTSAVLARLAEGEEIWSVESAERLARAGISLPRTHLCPTAQGLIATWLSLSEQEQAARAAAPAEPIYVRPPHITAPKHKPWEVPTA